VRDHRSGLAPARGKNRPRRAEILRSMEISRSATGAMTDPMRTPLNWGLLIAVLTCLAFWVAVVSGIIAATL